MIFRGISGENPVYLHPFRSINVTGNAPRENYLHQDGFSGGMILLNMGKGYTYFGVMKQVFLVITVLCVYTAQAQEKTYEPVETMSWHQLGNKKIAVKLTSYGSRKRPVLINLHHNETTSLEAARAVLSKSGGLLINIENDNERLISFGWGGNTYRFDPNRIFTEAGIRKTLTQLNKTYSRSALKQVRRFAVYLKEKIPAGNQPLVALHNNEEGDLSIASYVTGGELEKEAQQTYRSSSRDADNFFLTTGASLFRQLKGKGFNVVLQHNSKATDDGSLSVFYGRKKKAYVNVEAEPGKLTEQMEMLFQLVGLLK